MADDRSEVLGEWLVTFRDRWTWLYIFEADGSVTWVDPSDASQGVGRWTIGKGYLYITWKDSAAKEQWPTPIKSGSQTGWASTPHHGNGGVRAKKNDKWGGRTRAEYQTENSSNGVKVLPVEQTSKPYQKSYGEQAAYQFGQGFSDGLTSRLDPTIADKVHTKIYANRPEFYLGYTTGLIGGVLSGLIDLFKTLMIVAKVYGATSAPALTWEIIKEAYLRLTDDSHAKMRAMQAERAKLMALVVKDLIIDIQMRPSIYVGASYNSGFQIGRELAAYVSDEVESQSPREFGKTCGNIVGRVLFEIIIQIILAEVSAGTGNAARAEIGLGEATQGSSKLKSLIERLSQVLEEIPAIRRVIRAFIADEAGNLSAKLGAYINYNVGPRGATAAEVALGTWLDIQAQSGKLNGVGRVRGMPDAPNALLPKITFPNGRPDFHFLAPGVEPALTDGGAVIGPHVRADGLIAKGPRYENIMKEAFKKAGDQADVVVIELGEGASATIKDAEVLSWDYDYIFVTGSPRKLQRLIVVRNQGGIRTVIQDISRVR